MNIEELVALFKLKSSFGANKDIHDYIKNYLTQIGINFSTLKDETIFNIEDKEAPIFSAHTDTVRSKKDDKVASEGIIVDKKGEDFSVISFPKHVLGGDDLCGVFIILNLLKEGKKINFIFSNNEEVSGFQTARDFNADYDLSEYPFCIVLDRKGFGDIICYNNNYGSKEFEDKLVRVGTEFGFKPNRGFFSDAEFFRNQLSVANLSCGYFEPHTNKEFVIFEAVENTFEYCKKIIDELGNEKFEPNPERFSWTFERQILNSYERIYNSAFGRNSNRVL